MRIFFDLPNLSKEEFERSLEEFESSFFDLRNNNLFEHSGAKLNRGFKGIPKDTKTVDLSRNKLGEKSIKDLSAAFKDLDTIEVLGLSDNGFGAKSADQLPGVFSSIPRGVKAVDLSRNVLGKRSVDTLLKGLARLPKTVEYVNLCGNDFTKSEIENIKTRLSRQHEVILENSNVEENPILLKLITLSKWNNSPREINTYNRLFNREAVGVRPDRRKGRFHAFDGFFDPSSECSSESHPENRLHRVICNQIEALDNHAFSLRVLLTAVSVISLGVLTLCALALSAVVALPLAPAILTVGCALSFASGAFSAYQAFNQHDSSNVLRYS